MRSKAAVAVGACVIAGACGRGASPSNVPAASARAVAAATSAPLARGLEDVEETQGPFTSGGQTFTVVMHSVRLTGRADPDSESLAWLEIRDAAGAARYREEFAHRIENGGFAESCVAHAEQLAGSAGRGILLSVDCLPSAPSSGGPWAVFGVVGGTLRRFGSPLVTDGQMGPFKPGAIGRAGGVTQILADMLMIRLWTGYFFVTVPVRVDWQNGALAPGQQCLEQTGHGFADSGCEWPAEDAHPASRDTQTFVRLFRESNEGSGPAAHVVVNPSSAVEIVAGKINVRWNPGPDVTALSVDDDIWVRVRIDGREGWIHTEEDLQAAGLFRAG